MLLVSQAGEKADPFSVKSFQAWRATEIHKPDLPSSALLKMLLFWFHWENLVLVTNVIPAQSSLSDIYQAVAS